MRIHKVLIPIVGLILLLSCSIKQHKNNSSISVGERHSSLFGKWHTYSINDSVCPIGYMDSDSIIFKHDSIVYFTSDSVIKKNYELDSKNREFKIFTVDSGYPYSYYIIKDTLFVKNYLSYHFINKKYYNNQAPCIYIQEK
jgi:hypothetical protein